MGITIDLVKPDSAIEATRRLMEGIDSKIIGSKDMIEIACPSCGETFSVDRAEIAKRSSLQHKPKAKHETKARHHPD